MAKNRPEPEKSVDTEEESGQEEEEASSDENGGSDSEPEPPLTQVSKTQVSKKPSASAPKKPEPSSQSKRMSSSEESDSESEADSDSNPNVKPIASKPMDDLKAPSAATTPTKKPRSKPAAARPTSPTKSSTGTKRPAAAADGEAKESKKSKKKPNAEVESSVKKSTTEDSKKKPIAEVENSAKKLLTEDSKKQLFQRLWSEEDEIAVLKGMIAYAEEKNADPVSDLNAFHDFIRESLHIDATRTQLQDKIRRLKKKYENNAGKEKKGKERTFSKTHEQNAYDLSKKIWGGHKDQNGSVVKAAESSKASNASARKERIKSAVKGSTVAAAEADQVMDEEKEANTNMDVDINLEGSKGLNLIGGSLFGKSLNELAEWIEKNKVGLSEEKLTEMEEKWKALKIAELELFLKRAALIQEQGKLVLDALK